MKLEFMKKMKRMSEFRERKKRKMMNPHTKKNINSLQSGYFSKPFGLETPGKYEY